MHAIRRILVTAALALCATGAWSQAYPNHPVTLVVPFAAGGPTDVVARALGAAMSKSLGQSVVIENKLGAGGTLAANYVAKAAPDGYTLLIHHNGMATAPSLYRKLPFNPTTDFEYVSQAVDVPMTLIGRKDLPPNTLQELIPYLKANAAKDQPGARRSRRRLAPVRHGVPPGAGRRPADGAVPGHRAGAERAARRTGRRAVRPDHADHAAHQGGQREAVRRDDAHANQGPARRADARRTRA
jgi:hypothetical protein